MYKSEDLKKEIQFPGCWRNPDSSNPAGSTLLRDKNLVIQVTSLHTARSPTLPLTVSLLHRDREGRGGREEGGPCSAQLLRAKLG